MAMPHLITHPSKEQVRAYMAAREGARRPPPPPEEIRRQLGWRLASSEQPWLQFCLLPSAFGQMASQLLVDFFFLPILFNNKN